MNGQQNVFIVEAQSELKFDIMKCMFRLTHQGIRKAILEYETQQHHQYRELFSSQRKKNLRPAAVMMPLLEYKKCWHLLFTHRSESLVEHSGQVAFPGGAKELRDKDLEGTALREMNEEIGINPQDVIVYGHLGDKSIVTGYMVRPYVGLIPWPYPLKISSDEVESTFIVPLEWLADPAHRTIRYRSFAGREFPMLFFDHFQGHQLWGFSAEMTIALLGALGVIIE